jgi:hypothetical protein
MRVIISHQFFLSFLFHLSLQNCRACFEINMADVDADIGSRTQGGTIAETGTAVGAAVGRRETKR